MAGRIKMFCIRMNILSHIGIILYCSWHATWPPCKTSIACAYRDYFGPEVRSVLIFFFYWNCFAR